MSTETDTRLTPRQRLTRGLTYTAVGPVDITRGVVGLGVHSTVATASGLRRRYRESRVARGVASELALAQEVMSGIPEAVQEAVQEAKQSRGLSKRPWVIAAVGAAVLAGGAAAFSIIRRSSQPEPSPRPPSVEVRPPP